MTSSSKYRFCFVVALMLVLADNTVGCEQSLPLVDHRDGQVYKTVVIGSQTWMAENLNYATSKGSYCYKNEARNCTKYGRLYTWDIAMGVCPDGWHLPTETEWKTLIVTADGSITDYDRSKTGNVAGLKLKASTDWETYRGHIVGEDTYGFSALPAGFGLDTSYHYDYKFRNEGEETHFWSATEDDKWGAYSMTMHFTNEYAYLDWTTSKSNVQSVRCVKDKVANRQRR